MTTQTPDDPVDTNTQGIAILGLRESDQTLQFISSDPTPSFENINLGRISDIEAKGKFGENPQCGTGGEDIWQQGGSLSFLSSAETMDVSSSSANDTNAGTGAHQIRIEGLDGSWNEISETVTMNGTTTVVTTNLFLRVNRAYILGVGSNGVNVGGISIDATTAGTVQAFIGAGLGQTLKTQVSIPANRQAYITGFFCNVGKGDDAVVFIEKRTNGQGWRVQRELRIFQNHIRVNLDSYIPVEAMSDIRMRAEAGTGNIAIAAGYEYIEVNTS